MTGLLFAALAALAAGQSRPELLPMNDFIEQWKISKQFTIAVAEKMPAEFWKKADGITVTIYPKLQDLDWIKEKCLIEDVPLQTVRAQAWSARSREPAIATATVGSSAGFRGRS